VTQRAQSLANLRPTTVLQGDRVAVGCSDPLDDLQTAFDEAASVAGGPFDRRLTIAGIGVCVRFASSTIADVLDRAFAHLRSDGRHEALVVQAWDSATSGMRRPVFAPTIGTQQLRASANVPGASYFCESPTFQALLQPDPDVLSVLSMSAATSWFWIPDARRLPVWDCAAPFRHLLGWWLNARGHQLVHGAAVGLPHGGALLVGRGGTGKSSTALATLGHPRLRYAGDDYVALSPGPLPYVHSLYCTAKVHWSDLERLPQLRSAVVNPRSSGDEKAVIDVPAGFPGAAIDGFPLRAIMIPRIVDRREPKVVATTRAAAMAALAPSTVLQRRPAPRHALSSLARLVRDLPAYTLEVGSDQPAVADAILSVLEP
jgi:hypothetical protein